MLQLVPIVSTRPRCKTPGTRADSTPTRRSQRLRHSTSDDTSPTRARLSTGSMEMPSSVPSENVLTFASGTPGRSGLEMLPNNDSSPARHPRAVPEETSGASMDEDVPADTPSRPSLNGSQHKVSPSVLVSSIEAPASLSSTGEGRNSNRDSPAAGASSGNASSQGGKNSPPESSSDPNHSAIATQRTASQITPGQRTPGYLGTTILREICTCVLLWLVVTMR